MLVQGEPLAARLSLAHDHSPLLQFETPRTATDRTLVAYRPLSPKTIVPLAVGAVNVVALPAASGNV